MTKTDSRATLTEPSPDAETKRTRILAAAERLFSQHGYDGVPMREIANEAGVGIALVTYHFQTKLGLYRAVFERRQGVIAERLAALRAVRDLTAADSLDRVVAAFVEPQMRLRQTENGRSFARLVAREATDPSCEERGIIKEFFDPLALEFIEAFRAALPDRPADYVRWGYLFAVGTLSMSVFDVRVARFGTETAIDLEDKTRLIVQFITAGLRGDTRDAGTTPA